MKLTTNRVNAILLTLFFIFAFILALPHILDQQIPFALEDSLLNHIYEQDELRLLSSYFKDEKLSWKEYFQFIWR